MAGMYAEVSKERKEKKAQEKKPPQELAARAKPTASRTKPPVNTTSRPSTGAPKANMSSAASPAVARKPAVPRVASATTRRSSTDTNKENSRGSTARASKKPTPPGAKVTPRTRSTDGRDSKKVP